MPFTGLLKQVSRKKPQILGPALAILLLPATASAVTYEATFTGIWNSSHSNPYPSTAHFTDLIGALHTSGSAFWRVGSLVSSGVEDVAELGSNLALEQELQLGLQSNRFGPTVNFGSLFDLPRSTTIRFTAEIDKPFITLISMVAPSPDWFVGISDLSLRQNGQWRENILINLRPYDAGTEEGGDFSLSNFSTIPPDPVSTLSGTPFLDRPVLATLRFRLIPPAPERNFENARFLPAIISILSD
ncbi:MAG: spondin domain-containing protein [Pseudomonadota bacterium]